MSSSGEFYSSDNFFTNLKFNPTAYVDDESNEALLREAGVDLVTIGQYLAPSSKHLAVDRFPEPNLYDRWAQDAIALGFSGIASGPLVRSSFKAGLLLRKTQDPNNSESMPGAYVYVASQGNEAPVHLKSGME